MTKSELRALDLQVAQHWLGFGTRVHPRFPEFQEVYCRNRYLPGLHQGSNEPLLDMPGFKRIHIYSDRFRKHELLEFIPCFTDFSPVWHILMDELQKYFGDTQVFFAKGPARWNFNFNQQVNPTDEPLPVIACKVALLLPL